MNLIENIAVGLANFHIHMDFENNNLRNFFRGCFLFVIENDDA